LLIGFLKYLLYAASMTSQGTIRQAIAMLRRRLAEVDRTIGKLERITVNEVKTARR
jgi:hypothetical protein